MKYFYTFFVLFAFAGICSSCDLEEEMAVETDDNYNYSGSSAEGYWVKHNQTGYIQISGSTARFCMASNGNEWVGSYYSSDNSIEIDLGDGYIANFIAKVNGSEMTLIQHFSDGHSTNTTYYSSSSSSYPCSGGGSTGGSGGDSGSGGDYGSSTGSLVIWTDEDHGCGNLEVYVNGNYVGAITGYYSSGTPDCGDSYTVTLTGLEPGSYSVKADCEDGTAYWPSNSITISAGACSSYLLN